MRIRKAIMAGELLIAAALLLLALSDLGKGRNDAQETQQVQEQETAPQEMTGQTALGQAENGQAEAGGESAVKTVAGQTESVQSGEAQPERRITLYDTDTDDGSLKDLQQGLYYYEALQEEEKELYVRIYDALVTRSNRILPVSDEDTVSKVYQAVSNDHPEIFYASGYMLNMKMRGEQIVSEEFQPKFIMTPDEQETYTGQIEAAAAQVIGQVPAGLDEYGKVKYIYDYLIRNTEYELNCENNQNICSVFVNHKSVCLGYAKAAQYLLRELGFDVTLTLGKAKGESHCWNLICVDGEYYYMDVTWGDADFNGDALPAGQDTASGMEETDMEETGMEEPGMAQGEEAAKELMKPVNYDYFLVTTKQISMTHEIDSLVPMPACIATRNNYFVREGVYFTSYDTQKLKDAFERAYAKGDAYVSVMCDNSAVYEEMKRHLFEEQEIFQFLHEGQSATYINNDKLYSIICFL